MKSQNSKNRIVHGDSCAFVNIRAIRDQSSSRRPVSGRVVRELICSMAERRGAQAEGILGDLSGRKAVVLGAAYRGGVKETAFSGVFPTVSALTARGAEVVVPDPLYTDDELRSVIRYMKTIVR